MVRLKVKSITVEPFTLMSFNSLMVRLKDLQTEYLIHFVFSFNSLMVRLKGGVKINNQNNQQKFQFLDGSIKSQIHNG